MKSPTTRRGFLKSSLFGVSGVLLVRGGKTAFGYQANDKLNIAAVGIGGMGRGNVANVSGEAVVALCDVHESHAAKSFEAHPQAKRFQDFRRMLDEMHGQIDAVVVSTPDHTHAVAAVAAMKLGKHVYCEKPLARTVFETRVMRETAAKHGVVTQMGNQGSASEGLRRSVELAFAGTVGEVREAHVWFGGGNGPMVRPQDEPPVPPDVAWDLWLGPAPERPYHPAYLPATWRSWRAFGSGGMGDMGCHTVNMVFRGLRLDELWNPHPATPRAVIGVKAEASEVDAEGYPRWMQIHYDLPARGELPPVKLTFHTGGKKPSEELMRGEPMTDWGALLSGSTGAIFSSCPWNTRYELLPKKQFEGFEGPAPTLPRPANHHAEWIDASKGRGQTFSPFAVGGPLAELIQLGNAAVLIGRPFEYDPLTGQIPNAPEANRHLHREYRKGWTL
ncbi:MAG: Gfo/Idh/MocA family oxidoreductase [Planctomycetota bacterium]